MGRIIQPEPSHERSGPPATPKRVEEVRQQTIDAMIRWGGDNADLVRAVELARKRFVVRI